MDTIGALAGGLNWEEGGPNWLHPTRGGAIHLQAVIPSPGVAGVNSARNLSGIGFAGQLAKRMAERLRLRQEVFLAELELDPFYDAMKMEKAHRRYQPLPRFPAVERDFSVLLGDGTRFADVARVIQSLGIGEISSIDATDLYRGKNVPAGKYSLLVRVLFQSREGTFTDAQLSDFSKKIVAALEKRLGAQLRAG